MSLASKYGKFLGTKMGILIQCCILVFFISACASDTTFLQDFSRLRKGMDKGDVTDKAGNPVRREHWQDKDWWYYSVFENRSRVERLVVFQNGKLIYAGKIIPRTVSDAEADDLRIQRANEELDRETERARVNAVPMPASPPTGIVVDKPD